MIKLPAYKNNYLATGLFLLVGILSLALTLNSPIADFGNYYYGSKLVVDGQFLTGYQSIHDFNQQIRSYGETNFFENYLPVPPFSLLFYTPFTALNCSQAKLLFNLISLLVFCYSFLKLTDRLRFNSTYTLLVPIIFIYPLYTNIYQGQTFLLVTAFLIESYIAEENKKPLLSALFLALSVSLKLFPVFILLYYLLKKSYKTVACTILLILGLQLFTLLFVGQTITSDYFLHILPRLMDNDIIGTYYFSNQSLYTLLLNLFSYEALQNTRPLIQAPWLVPFIESIFVAVILAALYAFRKKEQMVFFGITLFFCMIAGRYNTSYGMLILIPFVISLLADKKIEIKTLMLLFILLIAISMPVGKFVNSPLLLQYSRLMGLLIAFVLLIVYYKPKIQLLTLLIILSLVTALKFYRFRYNRPVYFEVQNTQGILYDYKIQNDSITLFSTMGDHDHIETLALKGKAEESKTLAIHHGALYYHDINMYPSPDNKQKPFIYNDTLAVFMSDMNQGLGFYKLRMIPLK